MQVDAPLVLWIMDYLTGRPQYMRLRGRMSNRVVSNTGAPQGTVLSPFLTSATAQTPAIFRSFLMTLQCLDVTELNSVSSVGEENVV